MENLITTIIARPYVFLFLAAFLFLSIKKIGLLKTIIWLITGYFIAWASEYSSIYNGFPYGEYHYVYKNMSGELMIFGVPFFDSLSYTFLTFAGFSLADYSLSSSGLTRGSNLKIALLGALFTMLLDVIIDPVATMGEKWFLGKIHYYSNPGFYFGVPLTNFAGWFLVSFTIIFTNLLLWKLLQKLRTPHLELGFVEKVIPAKAGIHLNKLDPCFRRDDKQKLLIFQQTQLRTSNILYPLFYIGIALFNIIISFWIKEWILGIVSSIILFFIFFTPYYLKLFLRQNKEL